MQESPPIYHIYGDESCTQHKFTTIGSVFCSVTAVEKITGYIDSIVTRHGGSSELKWSKVKKHNLPMYKEIISLFFNLRSKNMMHYYCLAVDNSKMDHKKYNDGDKEIGFNKMLFFHLLTFARRYRQSEFMVYLDDRTTVHTPEQTRHMLNGRVASEMPGRRAPYRVCQFRLSHEVRLIQMADILTGAIGAALNGHHLRADTAVHKLEMIRHFEKVSGHASLSIPTGQRLDGFEIWHFDLDAKKRSRTPRR